MGMYTGIRFKGIIKKHFRDDFIDIALHGDWKNSSNIIFKNFSLQDNAEFIPCGALAYMPDSWEDSNENATDGFNRKYDNQTGYWSFQCSLKNYHNTIESFFEILPYFVEKIIILEYFYEEWENSKIYFLKNGEIKEEN